MADVLRALQPAEPASVLGAALDADPDRRMARMRADLDTPDGEFLRDAIAASMGMPAPTPGPRQAVIAAWETQADPEPAGLAPREIGEASERDMSWAASWLEEMSGLGPMVTTPIGPKPDIFDPPPRHEAGDQYRCRLLGFRVRTSRTPAGGIVRQPVTCDNCSGCWSWRAHQFALRWAQGHGLTDEASPPQTVVVISGNDDPTAAAKVRGNKNWTRWTKGARRAAMLCRDEETYRYDVRLVFDCRMPGGFDHRVSRWAARKGLAVRVEERAYTRGEFEAQIPPAPSTSDDNGRRDTLTMTPGRWPAVREAAPDYVLGNTKVDEQGNNEAPLHREVWTGAKADMWRGLVKVARSSERGRHAVNLLAARAWAVQLPGGLRLEDLAISDRKGNPARPGEWDGPIVLLKHARQVAEGEREIDPATLFVLARIGSVPDEYLGGRPCGVCLEMHYGTATNCPACEERR